jgi:hypothetical protein
MNSTLSVRDLCEHYAVTEHTVLQWFHSGQLKAVNVGRRLDGKKPRWRISTEAFEQLRTHTPPPPRARRRKRPAEVIQFYK